MRRSALSEGSHNRRRLTASIIIVLAMSGAFYAAGQTGSGSFVSQLQEFGLVLLSPIRWVGSLPARYQQHKEQTAAERDLAHNFQRLQRENRELQAQLLQLDTLNAENTRLRRLLNAQLRASIALKTVAVARRQTYPLAHRLVLQAGQADGITTGAPVLTPDGVLGVVAELSQHEAVVALISEDQQAIPAVVERSGATTIVHGLGDPGLLKVSWLPQNTDIRRGDRLLSSGLGKTYPQGWPLAEIVSVESQPGERFLRIQARALARASDWPEVMVVMPAATDSRIGQTDVTVP